MRRLLRARCAAIVLAVFALAAGRAGAHERQLTRIPSPFQEVGQTVSLVLVSYQPAGPGPFPAVVFHHGSTGAGSNPAAFSVLFDKDDFARFFTDRGWMIFFPQRRGRGGSGGLYDEGFEADRSRYTCQTERSIAGMDRALQDAAVATDFVRQHPAVDRTRIVVAGQSRGGVLSVAYAGRHPEQVTGAVNFVGGWIGEMCGESARTNTLAFGRGGVYPKPTLWLYGENDMFYSTRHSRGNFDGYVAAGGIGEFKLFTLEPGGNGHRLIDRPHLWRGAVGAYLDGIR